VKALGWVLSRYRDSLLVCLVGLMVGSLRVLWPWPNGVGVISEVEDEVIKGTALGWPENFIDFFWPMVLSIIGFTLVLGILRYEKKSQNRVAAKSSEIGM
jgi:putative membrane protein